MLTVNDPSGRLKRWRLGLSEFDFDVEFKKGKANKQADALSRLTTLGETALDVDDDIPCFLMDDNLSELSQKEDEVDEYNMHEDALLLTLPPADYPSPMQITLDELHREQDLDRFCHAMRSRLNREELLPFENSPSGLLCRYAT